MLMEKWCSGLLMAISFFFFFHGGGGGGVDRAGYGMWGRGGGFHSFSYVYRNKLSLHLKQSSDSAVTTSGPGCSSLTWSWGGTTYVCTVSCRMRCRSCIFLFFYFFLELNRLPDGLMLYFYIIICCIMFTFCW